jgi:trehalose 6-phosphate phosphatase
MWSWCSVPTPPLSASERGALPVTTPPEVAQALAPLLVEPARSALLFDFDGTLSPIVDDPDAVRPAPGAIELLAELAQRFGTVGAVSGRPVEFLVAHLPEAMVLSGLYGLEWSRDGVRRAGSDDAEQWRPVVADAAARAESAGIEGVRVEAKGLSVTLHYRNRPGSGPQVEALARELADDTGLLDRPAKMSVELHPPVTADKGLAVRELAEGADAVLYVGDDLGDLPAYEALAELRAGGTPTVAVAVATTELPEQVRAVADVVVAGTDGVIELLRSLAAGGSPARS